MGNFAKPTILGVIAVTAAFAGAAPPLANVPRRGHWGDLDNKRECTTSGVKVCQVNDTHAKFDNQLFLRNPDGTLVEVPHPSKQPKAETLSPPVAEAKPQRLDVISYSTNSTNSNQTPAPVSQKNTSNNEIPILPIALSALAWACLDMLRRRYKCGVIPIANNDQIPMQEITQLPSNGNSPNDQIPQIPMQEITQLPSNGNSPVVVNLNSQLTFALASGASDRASELPSPSGSHRASELPSPSGSPRIEILIPSSPLASGLTEVR